MQTCCLLSSTLHVLMVRNLQNYHSAISENEYDGVAGKDALICSFIIVVKFITSSVWRMDLFH